MENTQINLYKTFFAVEQPDGKYSAFVQIAGFDSEEEAKIYVIKKLKSLNIDIFSLENPPTIH